MARYNLLVFDWDGTVADSVHHIVTAMEAAIDAVQLPVRTPEQIRGIIGLGMYEAARALYPDVEEDLCREMVTHYGRNYLLTTKGNTVLFPGVRDTLEQLRESGYLLAVATGKSRRGLERVFAETGIKDYFHTSRCADETFSKPHPQMLHEIMQALGAEPGRSLMIGDSHHDLQMAINADVGAIAVSYGAQPVHRLLEFKPLTTLDHMAELPVWLNNQTDEDEQ
jgi:phosphoglycolate phosphatase